MSVMTNAEKASYDSHVIDNGNPHSINKTKVGLSDVDNTSDADKPISDETLLALNAKEASLGNPAIDGFILSSTTAGVRAWIATLSQHNDLNGRSAVDCHSIGAINGLANALDARELHLGTPAADGYVLKSLANGSRYWEQVISGAADWGSIGGDINAQADLQAQFTAVDVAKEDDLGNPASNGDVLTSDTAGNRSWKSVSDGGVIEFAAIATNGIGDGTIEGDINAMDWTGHPHANGTALEINITDVVTFGHGTDIAYRWVGNKPVQLGVGGNHIVTSSDLQVIGTNDHNVMINRTIQDQHPQAAITDLEGDLAGKAPVIHNHSVSEITDFPTDHVTSDIAPELNAVQILNMVSISQAGYDALVPTDQTLYFIVD